jgi:gallate 1-beta-glucosyltransferase
VWGDQCTDAKFLVDELKMVVRLRGPLRRDAVWEAVDADVAEPVADEMLASARRWSAAAWDAMAPDGSSNVLTRLSACLGVRGQGVPAS